MGPQRKAVLLLLVNQVLSHPPLLVLRRFNSATFIRRMVMICSTTKTTRTRNGPWYFTHKYADRRRLRRMVYRSSSLFRLTRFTVVRSECQCFLESGEDDIKNGMRLALMVTSTYHNRR